MRFTRGKSRLGLAPILAVLLLSACGGSGVGVSGVTPRVYAVNGDQWVEAKVDIVLGDGLSLPSVTLPIHLDGRDYGTVSVGSSFSGGGGFLALAVNLTQALRLPAGNALLPNGLPIPLGGIANVPIISIPVGGAGSQVYLAYGDAVAMLGAAVVIPALSSVGSQLGTSAILPAFQFSGVSGIGGIFSSRTASQNGFAVFLNIRGLFPPSASSALAMDGPAAKSGSAGLVRTVRGSAKLRFQEVMPSASKQRRAWEGIERLRSQRAALRAR